ncbi:maleylacetoacetate isomerase [Noviherbaspirillum humi]|uniref:Maleylacetoacetate isomerase n=1 Tax=Noviherbaspirillum humi TaxID=1688639 RepID=A0A239GIJ1_9BURK|nr:maleylacetoacetate isomerase [Noviherbaspirillum humi]SNS67874.1 maleylacetoacetate isomerase [Noviherbaspirillum humi]
MAQNGNNRVGNNDNRILHNYFRSSSSYRVRIALNLKGLPYTYAAVHLNRNGGEQFQDPFKALNPQALVPVLSDGGLHISQSLAILEYLEEKYPEVPLLPKSIEDRAYVRQLGLAIACEIHPINNLRVLKYLTGPLGLPEEAKNQWTRHWINLGLEAIEAELARSPKRGRFCFGDTPTLADICLVPQMFNAARFGVDLSRYPTLSAIDAECNKLPAFQQAHPGKQVDSE